MPDLELDLHIDVEPIPTVQVTAGPVDLPITAMATLGPPGAQGPPGPTGPQGPPGVWVQVTQAEYDALTPPDPETLYVIVG